MGHTSPVDPTSGKRLPVNIVHASNSHVVAFLVLNMWPTFLGLPLLLAIIWLSRGKIKRHPTFINQCVAFMLIGLSCGLLSFSNDVTGPEPDPILCLFQGSLILGMPPLASLVTCMLVLQMFLKFRSAHNGVSYDDSKHRWRVWAMVIIPYVGYFTFILATAIVGSNNPDRVSRSRRVFYCSVDWLPLSNTVTTVAAVVLLITVVLEIWSIVIIVKLRKVVMVSGGELRGVDFSFSIRILAFGLYIVAAMSLCVLSVTSPASPVPDLVIASAASVIVIIFGTQADMLRALCFWRGCKWSPWWTPAPPTKLEPDFKVINLKYAFDPESTQTDPNPNFTKKPVLLS